MKNTEQTGRTGGQVSNGKRDLQPHLPAGYNNPKRVQQFRAPDPFPILASSDPVDAVQLAL